MNIVKKFIDESKYKQSNDVFENYMKSCKSIKTKKISVSDFTVSTITCISFIADVIDIKRVCQFLNVTDNNHIAYIEADNVFKGIRKHKKAGSSLKKSKLKDSVNKTRNQLFSNQMSVGIECTCPKHCGKNEHKNPISVKLFRNGRIQITGCKDDSEIKKVYTILYNELLKIPSEFNYNGTIIKIPTVKGLISFEKADISIEMLNGTFKIGSKLNLKTVMNFYKNKYTKDEIFRTINKKSRINLSIKKFQYFDKKKSKWKMPQVFIYNTGSVNIIATTYKLLENTYKLLCNDIKNETKNFALKELVMNDRFINDYNKKFGSLKK